MNLLKHDIATEFPEFKDKIQSLRASNAHFAKLFENYDQLNQTITRIETTGGAGAAMTDEALEIEKKKRLKLKDEIRQMLQQ